MNSQYIKEQVSRFKEGKLYESKADDGVIISEGYYDIREPCFMVHESLSIDGKTKFIINQDFVKKHSYAIVEQTIENEYNTFNRFFENLTTDITTTSDVNKLASWIALCNCGNEVGTIVESIKKLPYNDVLSNTDLYEDFKQTLASYIIKFKSFKDFSTTNMYLDEGLIKVPQKTLSFIEELIDVLIYNWAINSVYDESAYDLMKTFINTMGYSLLDIQDLSKKVIGSYISFDKETGFHGSVDIKIPKDDVPYQMNSEFIPLSIVFDETIDSEGISDEINGQPMIVINTKSITNTFKKRDVLNNPLLFTNSSFIDTIKHAKDEIMSSVVHELMHVMQHMIFAQNEFKKGVEQPKSIQKGDGDYDDYITAQVEFDPSISDTVYNFKRMVSGLEDYLQTTFDGDVKRELLKKYLDSGYQNDVPEYFKNKGSAVVNVVQQVFKPPYFVTKIKEKLPKKYPVMVKKIYSELGL